MDLEARDAAGKTPLMVASEGGRPETVKFLIEKGADIGARDRDDKTALAMAQANRHQAVVQLLTAAATSKSRP